MCIIETVCDSSYFRSVHHFFYNDAFSAGHKMKAIDTIVNSFCFRPRRMLTQEIIKLALKTLEDRSVIMMK